MSRKIRFNFIMVLIINKKNIFLHLWMRTRRRNIAEGNKIACRQITDLKIMAFSLALLIRSPNKNGKLFQIQLVGENCSIKCI